MKITEIPFKSIKPASDAVNLTGMPGNSWSPAIAFPAPVRLFGELYNYFCLSGYCGIRPRNKFDFSDRTLPEDIASSQGGYLLLPWGEPQTLSGCRTHVLMWRAGQKTVIDIRSKSPYDAKMNFIYQLHLGSHNAFECHYYHCISSYDSYCGVIADPDNFIEHQLKPDTPYSKKALLFDTSLDAEQAPVTPQTTWPSAEPTLPIASSPVAHEWENLYHWDDTLTDYRIQRQSKVGAA